MFDRVKICPHCGSTGVTFVSHKAPMDGFGGPVSVVCTQCDHPQQYITCSWELSHRILRRTVTVCRNENGRFYPYLWKPLPFYQDLGLEAHSALRKQVSEIWSEFIPQPYDTGGGCRWKLAALPELESIFGFFRETVGSASGPALTVQDFLSWCQSRGHFHCFG